MINFAIKRIMDKIAVFSRDCMLSSVVSGFFVYELLNFNNFFVYIL